MSAAEAREEAAEGETPEPARQEAEGPAPAAAQAKPDEAAPKPDYYEQLLRLKAEFENYRKRMDRERPEWVQLGKAGLLDKLLPLYDLLIQAHDQITNGQAAGADIAKGLELIFKEFTKVFEAEGVKPIESVGKPYHYDLHEALGAVETDEHPEGTVVDELQRGYTVKGKLLRPARVRIAKPAHKKEHKKKGDNQA